VHENEPVDKDARERANRAGRGRTGRASDLGLHGNKELVADGLHVVLVVEQEALALVLAGVFASM